MRNTIYAIIAASLAMLATSGIVALATAAPAPRAAPLALVAVADVQDEVDDYISEFIDREYQKIVEKQRTR